MADETTTAAPAEGQAEGHAEGQAGTTTLAALDQKVDRLADLVQGLTGRLHQGSQQALQGRLDAPGSVAEQVREELARGERERQATELAAKVESTAATVAQLAERPPAPPVRRVTRAMFGKDPAQ